jgi:uncharacterized glyoxalase superfamily protein PhnB
MRQNLNLINLGVADFTRAVQFYESLGWKQARALVATVVKPAQKVFWGGYLGRLKDLDGICLK